MAIKTDSPTRKKKTRSAPTPRNKKNTISFDGWEQLSGQDYHQKLYNLRAELYQNFKANDLAPEVYAWMKENSYASADIEAVKRVNLQITLGINCKLLRAGMPDLNPTHKVYWESLPGTSGELNPVSDWIRKTLDKVIESGHAILAEQKEVEKESTKKYVPSIQDRIRDQALEMSEDIDVWLEGFVKDKDSFNPKGFNFKSHFQKNGVTQAHARKMRSFFEKELVDFQDLERIPTAGQLKQMDEREADHWTQLKEAYSHLNKSDIKKYTTAIEGLLESLDFVIESAKATRKPRKSKPKSANKLVEKLKYCKTDDKFKLASIAPDQIVGASELWVFNVKTRKLGKYVAANIDPKGMGRDGSGLNVKGTTIIGFDENLSVQKTLRKPEEQLKEFKSAGKVALRKFLDSINTTDTKLNGRCNPDTILLKVL